MNVRQMMIGAALVITTAVVTTQVVSQQDKGNGQPQMSPEQAQAMQEIEAKWNAFRMPGENHKLLGKKVGKWTGVAKMWMDPHQPEPITSECTAEYEWIMDGRYLLNTTEGNFMGEPFHGKAWEGYDNLKKQYEWVWIDNMGTGFMYAHGTYDPATKSLNTSFETPDIVVGKYVPGRGVERWIDDDHFVSEMFGPGPDGKEFRSMEISYTRAK